MVEAQSNEVSDEEMMKSLEFAHKVIKQLCEAQIDYIKDYTTKF
jgi:polyribonucleotide nucleotidyltransferase